MHRLSEVAQRQGELWGRAVRDWVEIVEPHSAPVWNAALDAAAVSGGTRLLDAGCGAGGASLLAASRGAVITGIDASAPMITAARERMPHADLRWAELEDLPFSNGAFDAVMAINSVQFAANPQLALHELGRVTRSGGRVAVVVWDSPETSDMRAVFEAVQALFDVKPSGRGPFALSDPGVLEGLFSAVDGLRLERVDAVDCDFSYASLEVALRANLSTGPTQRAAEILGMERVTGAIRDALSPFTQADGRVILRNRFRCAAARHQ